MLLWYFLQGYAIIEIEAANIDRALFQISKAGIELVRVSRVSYTVLRAQVSRGNLRRLRALLQGDGRIQVRKKLGSWQWLSFGKEHMLLLFGMVLMAAAVFFLSSCCLRIEVVGNETLGEYEIYHVAEENGAKRFAIKSQAVLQRVEQALWNHFPELTYVYAAYEGSCLKIVVREKYVSPEVYGAQPCAVYAEKAGVITEITVYSGRAMVREGDRVEAGDLLIAGAYDIDGKEFYVHASGKVTAQVEYISSALLQQEFCDLQPTGREAHGRVMRLGKWEVPIAGENPFSCCLEQRIPTASIGENSPLFLQMYDVVYREAKPVYSEQKERAAVLEQKEKAYFEAMLQLCQGAEILRFDTHEERTDLGLQLVFTLSAREEIGTIGDVNTPKGAEMQTD